MPAGAGDGVSESAFARDRAPLPFVIPGEEMRSVSKTRNPAARASANLSRARTATSMPKQIAFGAAGSSGLRREDAACRRMTIAGDGAVTASILSAGPGAKTPRVPNLR